MKKYEKISKKMSKNLKNRKCPKNGMWIRGPPFCCQKFRTRPIFPDFVARNFCGPPYPPIKPIEKMRFSKKCKNTSKIREKRLSGQGWGGVPKFRENHFFSLKRALGLFCPIYSKKQLRKKSGALQRLLKISKISIYEKI